MPANSAPIGDAIVADINGLTWPTTLTASRAYLTTTLLESTTSFHCYVTPEDRDSDPASRGLQHNKLGYCLAFVQKVADATPATLDPLVLTVEKAQDVYAKKRQITVAGNATVAIWSVGAHPLYVMRALDEQLLFVAYLEMQVEAWN